MLELLRKRELTMGELLSMSWDLFKANIKPILFIVVIIYFPISILTNLVAGQMEQVLYVMMDLTQNPGKTLNMEAIKNVSGNYFLFSFILILISTFIEPLGVISLTKMTKERIFGKEIHYSEAIFHALGKTGAIFSAGILYIIFVFLTSIVIIPGIFFSVMWCFYLQSIALRDKKGWSALSHSYHLVRNQWWLTFGTFLLLQIIVATISTAITTLFMLAGNFYFIKVLSSVITYWIYSYLYIFMTVWFLNRDYLRNGFSDRQEIKENNLETPSSPDGEN